MPRVSLIAVEPQLDTRLTHHREMRSLFTAGKHAGKGVMVREFLVAIGFVW